MATNVHNRPDRNTHARFQSLAASAQGKSSQTAKRAGVSVADRFDDLDTGVERNVMAGFRRQFGEIAKSKDGFHRVMQQVFHKGYDKQTAEDYRRRALAGDYSWLPPVQLVDRATLQGGNGAYDAEAGVVYLSRDLNPATAVATYVEETGHHLDAKLNKTDTPGDEGEMLRRILGGETLLETQKQEIRTENDHGVINVNGKEVNVEFFSFKKAFKKIGRGIRKVVSGVGNGIKKVGNFISKGVKKVGNFVSKGIKKVGGFLKKIGGSVLKVLDKLSPFAPLLNLIPGIGTALYAAFNAVKAVAGLAAGKFKSVFGSVLSGLTGGLGGALGGVLGKVVNFGGKLFNGGALGKILNFGTSLFKGGTIGKIFNFGAQLFGGNRQGGMLGGILGSLGRSPLRGIMQRLGGLFGRNPLGGILGRIIGGLGRSPFGSALQRVADTTERIRCRASEFLPRVSQYLSPQMLLSRLSGLLRF